MTRWAWDALLIAMCALWMVALAVVTTGPSGDPVKFLTHPATAAWVQALGSVGAIVGGTLVVRWQVRQEHARERERVTSVQRSERTALRARAYGIAALATSRLARSANLLREDRSRAHLRNIVVAIEVDRNSVAAFPIWSLPNGATMVVFSTFPGMLDVGLRTVEDLQTFVRNSQVLPARQIDEAIGILDELVKNGETRIGELTQLLNAYVGD